MTLAALLLGSSLLAPLAVLAAQMLARRRQQTFRSGWLGAAPALVTGFIGLNGVPLSWRWPGQDFIFSLDSTGALLLFPAALLWTAVTAALWREEAPDTRFSICWFLTMAGSIGIFIADDLVSFYLVYALVSIPAYGLFAFSADSEKQRAGAVYMAFTIMGEALLLLAFAALFVASPDGDLPIGELVARLPDTGLRNVVLGLVIAGFGMKIGTLPFNGWMPLTYAAAPLPAAAVLSGAGVKAGVIGLIRFVPPDPVFGNWSVVLLLLGFLGAFYGVVFGLTQRNPRVILAYSSISQMGLIAAAIGGSIAVGNPALSDDVAFYGANHLLVKAALFLTIGAFAVKSQALPRWWLALAALLALSLAGMPLTGGALAKLALKPAFGSGVTVLLATLSSIGSTVLMVHFLGRLASDADAQAECPPVVARFWPGFAAGAILLPWTLCPGGAASIAEAFTPAKLLDSCWPIAVGLAAAWLLGRAGWPLPQLPPGDTVVAWEAAFRRVVAAGPAIEHTDGRVRQWPLAGLSLLTIVIALFAALAFTRA